MTISEACERSRKRSHGQAFEVLRSPLVHITRDVHFTAHDGTNLRLSDSSSPFNSTQSLTNTSHDILCYGTVHRVGVRFRKASPVSLDQLTPTSLNAADGSIYAILKVVIKEDRMELHNDVGFYLALLNSDTFMRVHTVAKSRQLQLEAVASLKSLQDVADSKGYLCPELVTNVNLNVYGPRSQADLIASELSRNRLYLQDPIIVPGDIEYVNPQFLILPEQDEIAQDLPNAPATSTSDQMDVDSVSVTHGRYEDPNGVAFPELDYDVLMDRFAHHDYLQQASVDLRMKTSLFVHQKEGLDFLLRRESSTPQTFRSLWELRQTQGDASTQTAYQHLITGAKSSNPEDIRGGILADEMGLGKSIMMISVIVASKASAFQYAVSFTTPPNQQVAASIAAKSTLLVVPSALLIDGWIEEIGKHTHYGTLSCHKFHGQSRHIPLPELLAHDVVLTTYGTIAAEFKRRETLLFDIKWYRVVLDEAHVIRNPTTAQFKAVTSISGLIRWCLTGTPIQNSLNDLGSLVSFLRIPILKEPAQFRRHVTRQTRVMAQSQQPDFNKLRLLIGSICLRRNKSVLPFSQAIERVEIVGFSPEERKAYCQLGNSWRQAIDVVISGHRSKETHQTVLEALLRLRIFCNQGELSRRMADTFAIGTEEYISILHQGGAAICHYCSCDVISSGNNDDSHGSIVSLCGRLICGDCRDRYNATAIPSETCPICKLHHQPLKSYSKSDNDLTNLQNRDPPSKIKALCRNLESHRGESKSVVFSFWKKSLDVVSSALAGRALEHLRIDGTLTFRQRKRVLEQFQTANQGMILLMTLGTGAVGLNNLSIANRVHILEPQWNPSVEHQAIGRILRLGQTKTVHVTRYVVDKSVEKSVQSGQLRKLSLAHGGFGVGKATDIKYKAQMLKDILCPDFAF